MIHQFMKLGDHEFHKGDHIECCVSLTAASIHASLRRPILVRCNGTQGFRCFEGCNDTLGFVSQCERTLKALDL